MQKKALLFPVQDFDINIEPQLEGCYNDIKKWKEVFNLLKFDEIECYKDEKTESSLPKISSFIKKLEDNDTGVIVFSGHGVSHQPYNAPKVIEGVYFRDKILYEYKILEKLPQLKQKAKLIMIFDSCFSRGLHEYMKKVIEARNELNKLMNKLNKRYLKNIVKDFRNSSTHTNKSTKLKARKAKSTSSERIEYPRESIKGVRQYFNVTYITAVHSKKQEAFEKEFNETIDDNSNDNVYGVFSYYATKAILEKESINYSDLKSIVNENISKEPNVDIKLQRMDIISGNKDFTRKLFT